MNLTVYCMCQIDFYFFQHMTSLSYLRGDRVLRDFPRNFQRQNKPLLEKHTTDNQIKANQNNRIMSGGFLSKLFPVSVPLPRPQVPENVTRICVRHAFAFMLCVVCMLCCVLLGKEGWMELFVLCVCVCSCFFFFETYIGSTAHLPFHIVLIFILFCRSRDSGSPIIPVVHEQLRQRLRKRIRTRYVVFCSFYCLRELVCVLFVCQVCCDFVLAS